MTDTIFLCVLSVPKSFWIWWMGVKYGARSRLMVYAVHKACFHSSFGNFEVEIDGQKDKRDTHMRRQLCSFFSMQSKCAKARKKNIDQIANHIWNQSSKLMQRGFHASGAILFPSAFFSQPILDLFFHMEFSLFLFSTPYSYQDTRW